MESCGRWVSNYCDDYTAWKERERERVKGGRRKGCRDRTTLPVSAYSLSGSKSHFMICFRDALWLKGPQRMCPQSPMWEGCLYLPYWCLIYAPSGAEEVWRWSNQLRVIQIYVGKRMWNYRGQALSANIYSSLMIIAMSRRAILEGSRGKVHQKKKKTPITHLCCFCILSEESWHISWGER